MTNMQRPCVLDVTSRMSACASEAAVQSLLAEVTFSLGFDFYLYGSRLLVDRGRHEDRIVTNYPAGWLELYQAMRYSVIDPVVRHAMANVAPVIWQERLFVLAAERELRENARSFGLEHGVTFPVHSRHGDVGLLSLVVRPDGPSAGHWQRNIPWGHLLAALTHDAMLQLTKSSQRRGVRPLTPREKECLKWIAVGKTNTEIASILGLSGHGVSYHVRNLMDKLEVGSRHHAISKAVALRLI